MAPQNDIVAVMDMDGFRVGSEFRCKELGMIKVGDIYGQSFFFDIGLRWSDLTEKDQKAGKFVQKKIHKLPFGVPRGVKTFDISQLEAIVKNFYRRIKKNPNSTIAYKGGIIERDFLRKLRFPSINLECFGSPKADKLFDQLGRLDTCGNHLDVWAYQHYAKVEVEAFAMWLEKM